MGLLRRRLGVLDSLALEMEKDADVPSCIVAVESSENWSGGDGFGNYEDDVINLRKRV